MLHEHSLPRFNPKILVLLAVLYSLSLNAENVNKPDPKAYQNFEIALKNLKDNMCPYLVLEGSRLPIVNWICRFPNGLYKDHRYTYDCCSGFERSKEEDNRCIRMEITWRSIINYLKNDQKVKTATALETNTGIGDLSADPSLGVYTVFVPRQDEDVQRGEMDYTGRDNSARMMVARGRYYSKGFTNRATIQNENAVDLKITTYSTGAVPPTHLFPTVLARLQTDSDLSEFTKALPQDLKEELSKPDSNDWYTVFAPSNRAWREAVNALEPGESVQNLVRQHVLKQMICARSIIRETRGVGPTTAGEYIKLTRTRDGSAAVVDQCNKQIPLTRRDLMSGTGVVHVIDQAIASVKAMGLKEAVACLGKNQDLGVEKAIREMQKCGTTSDSKASVILLPNSKAIDWMKSSENSDEFTRMHSDESYRCSFYAHHMLNPSNPSAAVPGNRGFVQGQTFHTDYKTRNGAKSVIVGSYSQDPSGNRLSFGAAVVEKLEPIRFRDGVIYVVKTVNYPPEKTILEIIQSHPEMKEIARKLSETGMAKEFSPMKGDTLFLAPIDAGWKTRNLENAYDAKQTRKLLQLHTVPHALFGMQTGFVGYETIQTVDSMLREKSDGKVKLIMKRNPDGNMFIGHSELPEEQWTMVIKWNKVGTDGVMWIIDWPIQCPAFTC